MPLFILHNLWSSAFSVPWLVPSPPAQLLPPRTPPTQAPQLRRQLPLGPPARSGTVTPRPWEMCVHIWVSAAHRMRVPHPSPLLARGVRLMWGWVANGGLLLQPRGKLPAPGCVPLHCPECAKPSRAGGGPDLWGMAGETQDPGPSSLKNGLGSPSRFPKLAPGGRKAQ